MKLLRQSRFQMIFNVALGVVALCITLLIVACPDAKWVKGKRLSDTKIVSLSLNNQAVVFSGTDGTVSVPYSGVKPTTIKIIFSTLVLPTGATALLPTGLIPRSIDELIIEQGDEVVLNVGDEIAIQIVVVAKNGSIEKYRIAILLQSSDAKILALSLNNQAVVFSGIDGTVSVPYSGVKPTTIRLNTLRLSTGAKAQDIDEQNIQQGDEVALNADDEITIQVVAESGKTETYHIAITFQLQSSDAEILALSLNNQEVTFIGTDGTVSISYSGVKPTKITLNTLRLSKKAKAQSIGDKIIQQGDEVALNADDEITIQVVAEDGNTKTYRIAITLESSDAEILALSLNNQEVTFIGTDGTVSISYSGVKPTKITLSTLRLSTGAKARGIGDTNIQQGDEVALNADDEITIQVVAEDGNTKTYRIAITLESSDAKILELLRLNNQKVTFIGTDGTVSVQYNGVKPTTISLSTLRLSTGAKARGIGDTNIQQGDEVALNTDDEITIKIESEDGTVTKEYSVEVFFTEILIQAYDGSSGNIKLGQAIKDDILPDDTAVITITGIKDNVEYTYTLGSSTGKKTSRNGSFTITKSELKGTDAIDGSKLSIESGGKSDDIATYTPNGIHTWQDLQAMRQNLKGDYRMSKNIVFPDVGEDNFPNYGFVPIGDSTFVIVNSDSVLPVEDPDEAFTGSFDGGGYTISGLVITGDDSSEGIGLFCKVRDGTIKDITIDHKGITGHNYVGALAGLIINTTVRNSVMISSTGDVIRSDGQLVGGLIGMVQGHSIVSNSYATGDVRGNDFVGGLVGFNHSDGIVRGYATGDVSGYYRKVGGLVGENISGTVRGYATGDVSGDDKSIGGLVGENISGTVGGYATGDVSGDNSIGGLVGDNIGIGGTVRGYATGDVSGTNNIGGLVGWNDDDGTVAGYATGDVSGDYIRVGGLVGTNISGTVRGYATGDVSGSSDVGGLVGWNDDEGIVNGYFRGKVYRLIIKHFSFGFVVGHNNSGEMLPIPTILQKSSFIDINANDITGINGEEIRMKSINTMIPTDSTAFGKLVFGTDMGEWTWVEDGKWPAINIGNIEFASSQNQPID